MGWFKLSASHFLQSKNQGNLSVKDIRNTVRLELIQLYRNKAFLGLLFVLLVLMILAAWNTHQYFLIKKTEVTTQLNLVTENDLRLVSEIDSLNNELATYESSYTLPTSGVRLTYNNHRLTWLPFSPFSIIAIGQGDLYSNYKKIVLYFNSSYEMNSEELVSPLEQLFGQLDLAFVWIYLLPLIILLTSFNVLSLERETGRLKLIASQPIMVWRWVLLKLSIRFLSIFVFIIVISTFLLLAFDVDLVDNFNVFLQLLVTLLLYSAFWFLLSFLINLAGFSSGKSLIILASGWVFFVFLLPSTVNLLAKEMNAIPSRLEIINHHQAMYNEMENNLEVELDQLYERHPDWQSDDPVTMDLSNSTGWNINYLAKQYIAQIKHQTVAGDYEHQVESRNNWIEVFRVISPSMIVQSAFSDMAGTSGKHYRSFLKQSQEYAHEYRQFVFKGLFTNHSFTSGEIRNLPIFEFDFRRVPGTFKQDFVIMLAYLMVLLILCFTLSKRTHKTLNN